MRQVGIAATEQEARQFAAYLITKGISAKSEEERDGWAVWVHEENQVAAAREEFEQFSAEPANPRYKGLEAKAVTILRKEEEKRLAAQRNSVNVREKWRSPGASQRAPFTMTLLTVSVVVTFLIGFGTAKKEDPTGATHGAQIHRALEFADVGDYDASGEDSLVNIKRGEVWRLVTPIFIHLDVLHLVFNMFMLVLLGRLLETRYGAARLAGMVLVIAVISNVSQAEAPGFVTRVLGGGHPFFGGMSGVVYGLFGYVWIYGVRNPASGMLLSSTSVFIMLAWIGLGVMGGLSQSGGMMSSMANIAHIAGLLCGVVLAQIASGAGR